MAFEKDLLLAPVESGKRGLVSKAPLRMWTIALAALVAIQLASGPVRAEESHAITVFVARKIITMDPGWPLATAVAVQGGRAVGGIARRSRAVARPFPPHARPDLREQILLPGFIEPHGHPLLGGTSLTRPLLSHLPTPNPYGPAFPGVKTKPAAFAKLREYVANARSPDETVLSWGYDVIAMGGKHLTKTELDEISTTQPILVWDASEHFVYANSAALRKYAVTRADTRTIGVTDKLIFNGVKFFADDAFLSLGMVMEDPGYTDGRKGIFITPPNRMVELWRPWWRRASRSTSTATATAATIRRSMRSRA